MSNCSATSRQRYIQWDDDVSFILDQHIYTRSTHLDFYSASSLKHYPDSKSSILCSYSLRLHG